MTRYNAMRMDRMVADEDEDRRGRGHVAVASMPLTSSESLHEGEGEVDKATVLAIHVHHCIVACGGTRWVRPM
jgi:hypothetical protein